MKNTHWLFFALLAITSLATLATLELSRPPTLMETALESTLRKQNDRLSLQARVDPMLIFVNQSHPSVLDVHAPAFSANADGNVAWSVAHDVTKLWLEQPSAPDELKLNIHPFHTASVFADVHWVGRRQSHRVRWQMATPEGPKIMWVAEWNLTTGDREQGLEELKMLLAESGWGKAPGDRLGWFSGKASSRLMLYPHQLSSLALLDAFQKAQGQSFQVTLCQGPGSLYAGPTHSSLSRWRQALRGLQWRTDADLRRLANSLRSAKDHN